MNQQHSCQVFLWLLFPWLGTPLASFCQTSISEIYAEYRPAMVHISSELQKVDRPLIREGLQGSGFIVSRLGYVLTVAHVIPSPGENEAAKIYGRVGSNQEQRYLMAVINIDRELDVALVKLPTMGGEWPSVPIGDSAEILEGSELLALGFPLGQELSPSDGMLSNRDGPSGTWQTSLAINRGNSGGPVISRNTSMVVGIAKGGYDFAQDITYAIPISFAGGVLKAAEGLSDSSTLQIGVKCTALHDIRGLGWESGHKTDFCEGRGFDGVHNPWGEYSAGGYCYTGDKEACIERVGRLIRGES